MELNHITINTQSSIRIEGDRVLYFDPFQITAASHDADIIFITHDHYDHFEPESIAKIKKEDTLLVAPQSTKKKVLSESGLPEKQCVFYDPGETHELAGLAVETIPSYNKMKPFHPKGKKYQGYIVTMGGVRYYVTGDTDVNEDIKKVQCDVVLLPIGGHYTMDKKQAAEYVAALQPKAAIPTHYGSIIGNKADGADFAKHLQELAPKVQAEIKLS